MAHIRDLSICTYLPARSEHILAVGWLDKSCEYSIGLTPRSVYEKLTELLKNPWQPFVTAGMHECELCQFKAEKSGSANLFIPHNGVIYVCPELITHYINAHRYQPPTAFCEALLACPPMKSIEYKQLLIASNGKVLWQEIDEC